MIDLDQLRRDLRDARYEAMELGVAIAHRRTIDSAVAVLDHIEAARERAEQRKAAHAPQ